MIENNQWQMIEDKYQRLMYMIAHRIGGDKVAHSFDDNYQDLCASALEASETFARKTEREFSEFFDTVEFDKYIKTCLWNKKNNMGRKITKKKGVIRTISLDVNKANMSDDLFCGDSIQSSSSHHNTTLQYEEVSSIQEVPPFEDVELDPDSKALVECLKSDTTMFKPNGRINISKISEHLGRNKNQIKHTIQRLRYLLSDYTEEN